jgi:hypothetical protein
MRRQELLLGAALLAAACAPSAPAGSDGTWVGTITTEGDVTTVVNESGSVWGGEAHLVEQTSIGVESGEDAYMLGRVAAVSASDDSIYVVDWQVPAVRVYDFAGRHVRDLGRRGQGPGEFIIPADVVVADSGEAYVIERNMRMNVFASDGTPLETWTPNQAFEVGFGGVLTLTTDNAVWVPYFDRESNRVARIRYGSGGFTGEPMLQPELSTQRACLDFESNGSPRRFCEIPFAPTANIVFTPALAWLTGDGAAYRFEVRGSNGSMRVVERYWDPVPVSTEERAHHRQRITEIIRERDPSWSWGDLELPDHKPAYVRLIAERNGRTWALREMPSRASTDCDEGVATCWRPAGYWLDGFDPEGRYLGTVSLDALGVPAVGNLPIAPLFIDGDSLLAVLTDDLGTTRVKRYRIVLPEEQ